MEFVQVRMLTNLSDPFPEKIVRERLPEGSAHYGMRLLDIVCYWYCNDFRFPKNVSLLSHIPQQNGV